MKKYLKFITFSAVLLMLAGGFFSCNNKEDYNPLLNTKWKLMGIGGVDKLPMYILEPRDCDECYIITFDADNTFSVQSTTNTLTGSYKIDSETGKFYFINISGTEVGEIGDGELYVNALYKIHSFSLIENELALSYNENKNYLHFKSFALWEEYLSQ